MSQGESEVKRLERRGRGCRGCKNRKKEAPVAVLRHARKNKYKKVQRK